MRNSYYDEPEHQYNYDPRGNLTQILENGISTAQYNFNPANLLISATTPKGKAEYTYNGFRNRVRKLETPVKDPMQEINYILDLTLPYDNLLMTKGSKNQSFTWGNELISAGGDESYMFIQPSTLNTLFREVIAAAISDILLGFLISHTGFDGEALEECE